MAKIKAYTGPQIMHYTLEGEPVPLARPRFSAKNSAIKVYDSQRQLKYAAGLQLNLQHLAYPLFEGPLKLSVIFYLPIAKTQKRKILNEIPHSPHIFKPDLDNLIKFLLDVAQKTIIVNDCNVASIVATKVHSMLPRTEFTIERLA